MSHWLSLVPRHVLFSVLNPQVLSFQIRVIQLFPPPQPPGSRSLPRRQRRGFLCERTGPGTSGPAGGGEGPGPARPQPVAFLNSFIPPFWVASVFGLLIFEYLDSLKHRGFSQDCGSPPQTCLVGASGCRRAGCWRQTQRRTVVFPNQPLGVVTPITYQRVCYEASPQNLYGARRQLRLLSSALFVRGPKGPTASCKGTARE